jgi:hypothetical protein
MYWKMSIDLSYPLVPSMGHHDPLDGWITYHELAAAIPDGRWPDLASEMADLAATCRGRNWATDDPLGIGGLLADAYRLARLVVAGEFGPAGLLVALLEASLVGLESYARTHALQLPAGQRLAFRELGLSLGLRAVDRLRPLLAQQPPAFEGQARLPSRLEILGRYRPLASRIEGFWLDPAHRRADSWLEHRDINAVMLATSLAPGGYFGP